LSMTAAPAGTLRATVHTVFAAVAVERLATSTPRCRHPPRRNVRENRHHSRILTARWCHQSLPASAVSTASRHAVRRRLSV
jgi:hypothetical protein